MDDLVQWLRAQLDEDERTARSATPGPWRAHDTHLGQHGHAATVLSGEGNDTDLRAWLPSMSQKPWDETRNVWADAKHIAEHDPARVLREIDADRKLIADYVSAQETVDTIGHPDMLDVGRAQGLEEAVQRRASAFDHRPGYREEWRP